MKHRNLLIFVIILAGIGLLIVWITLPLYREYSYWTHLEAEGVRSEAVMVTKDPADRSFELEFRDAKGAVATKTFGVSPRFYAEYDIGDTLHVAYLKQNPDRYELWEFVDRRETTKRLTRHGFVMGAAYLVLFAILPVVVGLILYMRRNVREEIKLEISDMKCPLCGVFMQEGYIPATSGVVWRRKNQRRGVITVLHGLPGTVWYNPWKLPRYPGYHCQNCKAIFFKYG